MRTTLTLDDDVAKLLSRARQLRKASLKDAVNEALRLGLLAMAAPAARRRHFETKSADLGECLIGNADELEDYLELQDSKVNSHIRKSFQEYIGGKRRPAEALLAEFKKPTKKTARSVRRQKA
jgi:hypothetical protein